MEMTTEGRRLADGVGLLRTRDVICTLGDRCVAWSRTTDTIRLDGDDYTLYVKRYRYPRWKHRTRGLFRGTLFGKSRARREFRALEKLRGANVPVVQPLGWGERREFGFLALSYIITKGVAGAASLARYANEHLLTRDDASVRVERLQLVRQLAETIRRMHNAGVCHGNLFLRNILYRPGARDGEPFVFLDALRVRSVPPNDPYHPTVIGDLAGLASIGPDVCRRAEVLAFAKAYLGVAHLSDKDRVWIRAVVDAGSQRRKHELYRLHFEKYFRREPAPPAMAARPSA